MWIWANDMRLAILFLIVVTVGVLGFENADADLENRQCSISLQGRHLPIFYDGQRRMNGDGSFYPGDGFHFFFKYKGSDTCSGFGTGALVSRGIDILSHDRIRGVHNQASGSQRDTHSHQYNDIEEAYLKTTHYTKILESDTKCKVFPGGKRSCSTSYVLADSPSFSYREDEKPSSSHAKKLDYYRKNSYKYQTSFSGSWGYAPIEVSHNHPEEAHTNEDDSSVSAFEQFVQRSCSHLQKNEGCVFGHAEIRTDLNPTQCIDPDKPKPDSEAYERWSHVPAIDVCYTEFIGLSLTVSGAKVVCNSEECKSVPVIRTSDLTPKVIPPDVGLVLSKPPVRDEDTYDAKNRDGTYYLWDPLAIHSEPVFAFKDERYKSIKIETEKIFQTPLQSEFECKVGQCDYLIEQSGLYQDTKHLGYGEDFSIYNATDKRMLGTHDFEYYIKVYNLDRLLNQTSAKIDALVVSYEPQIESYPYLALIDGKAKSWDNRNGLALEYFGSTGSGPDDEHILHEDRRSKINGFEYESYAFRSNPDYPYPIETQMQWSDAEEYQNNGECFSREARQDSFESHGLTANFVSSGAAKIRFDFAVGNEVRDSAFQDVTVSNVLQSQKFAGQPITNLASYEYTYPDANFGNKVYLVTSDANGERTSDNVSVKMSPDKKSMYTQDYVCKKVMFESGNGIFSNIAVSEMYGKDTAAEGTGIAELDLHRTSTWFTPYHLSQEDNYLDFSLDDGFDAPSPYAMELTVGEKTIMVPIHVSFTDDIIYVANLDQNNILNITSGKNAIVLGVNENFGPITKIVQNGEEITREKCGNKCPIPIPAEDVEIEVFNEWGGRAFAEFSPPEKSEEKTVNINWTTVSVIGTLGVITFAAFKIFKKLKKDALE